MAVKPFRKVRTNDTDLDQVQTNVAQVLDSLRLQDGLLNSELIKDILIPATGADFIIEHTLNRVPTGFIVVDIDKAAIIHRVSKNTRSIVVQTSVSQTTISILVF